MENGVLVEADREIDKHSYLIEFDVLDDSVKQLVIKTVWQAFKNILLDRIPKGLPIVLPYIGTLKITDKNKYANTFKLEIATTLGYNEWNEIPRDKLDDATVTLKKLLYNKITAVRAEGKKKRKSNRIKKIEPIKLNLKRFKKRLDK